MEFLLAVMDGKQKNEYIFLPQNRKIMVGRGENNDLQLLASGISRVHFYIWYKNDVFLQDAESANGTFVNGIKLDTGETKMISAGDSIAVGTIRLLLHRGTPDPSYIDTSQVLHRKRHRDPTFTLEPDNKERVKKHLKFIHQIAQLAHRQNTITKLMDALLEYILEEYGAERGCIMVKKDKEDIHSTYLLKKDGRLSKKTFLYSQSVLKKALNGEGTISADIAKDDRFHANSSAIRLNLRTIITVPIQGSRSVLGAIYIDSSFAQDPFDQHDLDLFTAIGSHVGLAMEKLSLETKLIASEKHYRSIYQSIIENSWDVIYRRKLDDSFVFISPSVEELLGFTPQELMENHQIWNKCIVDGDKHELENKEKLVLSGQKCLTRFRMITKNNKEIWIEETCYPVYNDNTVNSIQGILRDITKTKLLEERLESVQKMEALGLLAGGVAHDLNNILGGLVGYPDLILMRLKSKDYMYNYACELKKITQLALSEVKSLANEKKHNNVSIEETVDNLDGLLEEVISSADLILIKLEEQNRIHEYTRGIKKSAQLAADVVKDLLTMARREQYSLQPTEVNKLICDCKDSLEFKALQNKNYDITIKMKLSTKDLPVVGSPPHLIKSFMNLLINAIHAMPDGGELTIKTYKKHFSDNAIKYTDVHPGNYVVLEVIDTGEGIAEQDVKRIFEPFYSKKINMGGTGLGLAVVYGVIKDHSGFVQVKSTIKKGSSFIVYLPYKASSESHDRQVDIDIKGTESILVIDDIEEQRQLAKDLLWVLGYQVTTLGCGEDALCYLKQHSVDLVVIDIVIEDYMDGITTYQKIKEIYPNQKAIFISGFANDEKIQQVHSLGIDLVHKPYTIEQLGIAIRKELDKGMQN